MKIKKSNKIKKELSKLNKYLKYIIIFLVVLIIIQLGIELLITLKYVNPATTNIFLPCILYKLTGLQCAGCGITRATHQILNLNFKEAFILNPLIFIYAIFVIYLVIKAAILKILKKDIDITNIFKKDIKIILYIALVITVFFMIIRNIVNILI